MEHLLTTLEPQLRAIAHSLTPNAVLQEDLLQEMCVHLWEQWRQHADANTPSWYRQHCRYRALDYLRQGRSLDGKWREGTEGVSHDAVWEAPRGRKSHTHNLRNMTVNVQRSPATWSDGSPGS